MSEIYYPSEAKYARAKSAVENYSRDASRFPNKAEYKLVGLGKAQKLEGDDLVKFVYEGLGGAPAVSGPEASERKKKSQEAKKRAAERDEKAIRKERMNVK